MRPHRVLPGRAAAAALGVALAVGFPAGALAADSGAYNHAWGKDVVQTGQPDHFGGHEWCFPTDACQAGAVGDLGGEFGAGGPTGVALSSGSGGLGYVADPGNHRIQVFNNLGRYFIAAWGKDTARAGRSDDTGAGAEACFRELDCQTGVPGALGGELNAPTAVAVDSSGNVYVADAGNRRVQKFSSNGSFISAWGKDVVQGGVTAYEVCTVSSTCKAGAVGTGLNGEFTTLTGVAAGSAGQVFVADDGRIQRFDTSGVFQLAWGSPGALGGEFGSGGLGVALQGGSVFVADQGNHRVQKFDTAGVFQQAWGKGVNGGGAYGVCTTAGSCQAGSAGGLGGEMNGPFGIAVSSAAAYVVETAGQRVQKFDFNGVWSSAWGRGVKNGTPGLDTCTVAANCLAGSAGALGGELNAPQGIAVQEGSELQAWVGNAGDGRVDRFSNDPQQTTFTSSTSGHRYDVYYGTLSLSRPGGAVYRTRNGFASQLRVSQAAANQIAGAVGTDSRVSQGFAGTAPDGGSWITNRPDPDWWDRPNGPSAPIDQPTFDAQGLFSSALAAKPQLAAGETAACSDSTSVARVNGPEGVVVEETLGSTLIAIGPDRATRYFVRLGEVNYNDDTSYLLIDAHRRDRGCTVSAATSPPSIPACSDGRDNDGDQAADRADPGCLSGPGGAYNPLDTSEADESVRDLVLCGRRDLSLVRADPSGRKVVVSGLVSAKLQGTAITIHGTYGGKTKKLATVKPKADGSFQTRVKGPTKRQFAKARLQARAGSTRSVRLKLPQSLASSSIRASGGTITLKGKVQRGLVGKRNKVTIKRLLCGRLETVGSAKPSRSGAYTVRFKAPAGATAALYRAEARVRSKPRSKRYVKQFARAIGITLTGQTG